MKKPMLQIALDDLTIIDAINNIEKIKNYVDVIEIGTILLASEGKKAIEQISKKYSKKIIIVDGKIADAGQVFAKMFFDAGATFTTAICAAEIETILSIKNECKKYSSKKDVQIELTSNFSWNQVNEWYKNGIKQIVYHRSRDSQAKGKKWDEKDLETIKKLAQMGFKLTITGGITIEDIKIFKEIPIFIFIVGRSIREAKIPQLVAKEFKNEINRYW